MSSPRLLVGCMTGTSIDAIDAALVRVEGSGLGMRAAYVSGASEDLGPLAPRLRAFAEQAPMSAGEIAGLMRDFSLAHARVVRTLLSTSGVRATELAAICVHGQTVYHKPPVSWQMFNPWPLVHELGVPVVFDLRGADIAAGGQGAPITPIADWVLFRAACSRAIVNLGGFCNVTLLESDRLEHIRGFDVCACNLLLDHLARELLHAPYDHSGAAAQRGVVHPSALVDLDALLARQIRDRRSLGTGDEIMHWVQRWREHARADDLAATACRAIAQAIARAIASADEIILAGGGVYNAALVAALRELVGDKVRRLDDLGVPVSMREAAEMGVLGALCQDGVPITLPSVTHVASPAPISGCWAHASHPQPSLTRGDPSRHP